MVNQNKILLIMVFISMFSINCLSSTVEFSVNGKQKLYIRGVEAQINLIHIDVPILKIEVPKDFESQWEVRQDADNSLELVEKKLSFKKDLKEFLNKPHLRPVINISSSGVPCEINLRDGGVNVNKWTKSISAHLVQGKIQIQQVSSSVDLRLQKGDVLLSDIYGRINIDQFQGSFLGKNIQGDGDLYLFNVQSQMDKAKGQFSIVTQNGNFKIQQSSGGVQLDNNKASWTASGFQGRVEGVSTDGTVSLSLMSDSEVHLKSQTAKVQISLPSQSGAWLNLVTHEGEISAPSEIYIQRTPSEKIAKGKLKGSDSKANIFVKSQEGSIFVK